MNIQQPVEAISVYPVGIIRSTLDDLRDCPLQESEGAPEAYLEIYSTYIEAIKDLAIGDRLFLFTWLHLADRSVVTCHKRNLAGTEHFGVFSTRSPDRPNPIGLHSVRVVELTSRNSIKIFPMEALNGTPVIDIKPVI